ncbi:T6SS effector BTH_I2691 family protein [Burkholderia glumae]|uniref:T6SS effector BTH_I2691 family protein n=1 Tax=Burkholderia glumae TaxID=337 RepID=UPI0013204588|nr:T6SS effector BTH_I2691 family protein [Burkholderia glumae]QHE13904.1 hypothetical protein GQR88_27450 [Burkholderia glumae AU6208]
MTQETTCKKNCANCEKTGLPILPVRYAVLPKNAHLKLPAGITGKGMTDIALQEHQYGLRTLREGWLFVFYERGARGRDYWQAYRVTPDGRLWKQDLPLPREPRTDPACVQTGVALQMDIITVEQPQKCGTVWLAFSEHAWHDEIFKQYASNAALRAQRMQSIEPAQWIGSGTDPHGHAVLATQACVDDVVEYMPGFDSKLLNPPPAALSDGTGQYKPDLLARVATRYPLAIRQATPDSASTQLVKLMHTVGETSPGKSHPPMLLALWDGIGAVHELNGFRNDAGSMLQLYVKERAAQVDAMQSIDEAEILVRNGAVASKSRMRSALQAGWEALKANPYAGDGVVPITPLLSPAEQAASDRRIEAAGEISPAEAQRIGNEAWPKYREKLNTTKLDHFKSRFEALQHDIEALQAKRADDIDAWLKAPVLLATLHDYSETDIGDGVAFDGVVAEAITGLPSEAKGEKIVETLVNQTDPTQATSLVWRAYAYNQREPKAEIKELLAQATAYRAPLGEQLAEWSEKIAKALEKLKTFSELREKIGEVDEHATPVSSTEAALKKYHTDRLVVATGNALFKWTGIGKTGDCAGEYLIRAVLMMRVGISKDDTVKIVKEAVKAEPALREAFERGYQALRRAGVPAQRAFTEAMRDLAADKRGEVMRAQWNAVRVTKEGEEAATGIRIAGVLAIIEVFCFAAALTKVDKSGQDYALLVASGLSATSACLTASTKAMTAMAEHAAGTLANLKAITGYFGGVSALIGAVVDATRIVSNVSDGKVPLATAYIIKSALGFAAASANLLTAMSSSAPLIARIVGGKVAWLGKAGAGIEGAAARAEALAAGKAVDVAVTTAMDAAAEEAGVVLSERAALLLLGRAVLFLSGWEIAIVITIIQLLISYLEDDDLQSWLEKCTFGKSPNSPPWSAGKQHEGFETALKAIGLQAEGSEK